MPRHAYWVILVGTTATAFRAATRDALVPTLRQLQRTQPEVTLRWFERERIWESPDAARFARRTRPAVHTGRGAEWRPGGDHRDPHARFALTRDQKRARFKARARRPKFAPPAGPAGPHSGDRPPKPRSAGARRAGPGQRRMSRRPPRKGGGPKAGGGGPGRR